MRITFPASGGVAQVPGLRRVERPSPDPAAGVGWSFPVRDRYARLISGQVHFVASAAVASRAIDIQIADGQGAIFRYSLATSIVASQTWDLNYVGGLVTDVTDPAHNRASLGLPNVWLPPGYTISAPTQGIDAADQFTGLVLWLEYLDTDELGVEVGYHDATLPELLDTTELHSGRRAYG